MAPADDPEEFIRSSVYWYPLLFPNRTEVLDHMFLVNGNGFEWGDDGNLHSVFAHLEPGEDCIARTLREVDAEEARDKLRSYRVDPADSMAAWLREDAVKEQAIRDDYLHLARTYGPPRVTEQVPGPGNGHFYQARTISADYVQHWTLLGRVPQNVAPRWAAVLDEVRELFAPVFSEQGKLW